MERDSIYRLAKEEKMLFPWKLKKCVWLAITPQRGLRWESIVGLAGTAMGDQHLFFTLLMFFKYIFRDWAFHLYTTKGFLLQRKPILHFGLFFLFLFLGWIVISKESRRDYLAHARTHAQTNKQIKHQQVCQKKIPLFFVRAIKIGGSTQPHVIPEYIVTL